MSVGDIVGYGFVLLFLVGVLWPAEPFEERYPNFYNKGESMPTTTNLPEGVTDTFTFACECKATVGVVGGVRQPHDCPLTEDERQAIRDAAAEAFDGT